MLQNEAWNGFEGNIWRRECNVRDFIQKNYTPYEGDESFLADPTEATNKLWGRLQELQKEEREKGVQNGYDVSQAAYKHYDKKAKGEIIDSCEVVSITKVFADKWDA